MLTQYFKELYGGNEHFFRRGRVYCTVQSVSLEPTIELRKLDVYITA